MKIFYQITYPNVHNQYLEIVRSYPKHIELIFPQSTKTKKFPLRLLSRLSGVSFGTYEGKERLDLLHLVDRLEFYSKTPWITEFGDMVALM